MIWLAIFLGITDQVVKYLFQAYPAWTWAKSFGAVSVFFSYFANPLAAFSLPIPARVVAWISLVIVAALFLWLLKAPSRQKGWIALVLVGAISNLIDRYQLGFVIDYMGIGIDGWRSSHINLADVMIVLGLIGWSRAGTRKYELEARMSGKDI